MSSLSAIPGYDALESQRTALKAQIDTLLNQRDAAAEAFGGIASPQAQQYQQQAAALTPQYLSVVEQQQQLILNGGNTDLASPTVNTGQSQSTPVANAEDDGPKKAPTSSGAGAGTTGNAATSKGPEDNPPTPTSTTQQAINTAFSNQLIVAQPNVLDQYASYTYAISWWLLTPEQFNGLSTAGPAPNTGAWSLLMQSGGAPIKGRNQAFPYDYYLDDLEIESQLLGKGTNMSTNGMSINFKVVEPNGLTLLQNLYTAVNNLYKSIGQPYNYNAVAYCLTIEFYGYDSRGKLVAPATGNLSNSNAQAVIKKYYPFNLVDIKFRTTANQIVYNVEAAPLVYNTATSQSRGTIPFSFALAGQTVSQLLQGSPIGATNSSTNTAGPGERKTTPAPNQNIPASIPSTLPSIVTGQDNPLATPGGMDFTPGNF